MVPPLVALAVIGDDWCRRWFEGLPHYVDVPGGINVSEILREAHAMLFEAPMK